jgi:hypothetical protein
VPISDATLPAGLEWQEFRNVTEVHYGYKSYSKTRIAFESDIHQTGCTWDFNQIEEFEVTPETEKAESF